MQYAIFSPLHAKDVGIGSIVKAGFHIIVAIDGFHMIAAIAEKVNEDRGDLLLTTSFAQFVKFNVATVNRRFPLEGCFLYILMGVFNINDDGENKEPIDLGFKRSFQKKEFWYFAVGNVVHPGIFAVATIATIAGEWFRFHIIATIAELSFFSDHSDRSDHMETGLKCMFDGVLNDICSKFRCFLEVITAYNH